MRAPLDYDQNYSKRQDDPCFWRMVGAAACGLSAMFALYLLVSLFFWATEARAHDALPTAAQPNGWTYPWGCCSNQDCRQAATSEVRETPTGYQLATTGEVVGYQDKRIKESPSGDFHVCQQGGDFDKGRVLCLFAPGRDY